MKKKKKNLKSKTELPFKHERCQQSFKRHYCWKSWS